MSVTRTRTLTLAAGVVLAALAVLTVVVAVLLTGNGSDESAAVDTVAVDAVTVELRVWQHVDDPEDLRVSARLSGHDSDALPMVPFDDLERSGSSDGYAAISRHRYGDVLTGGVALRVWQRITEPASIFVQSCASSRCPEQRSHG